MSRRTTVRNLGRSTRTRSATADVRVRYCCPRCGGDHPAAEHDLHARGFTPLDPDDLHELRALALEELPIAVRDGAGPEHLQHLAALVAAVDARLERLDA